MTERARILARSTFKALSIRNYRLFFVGQLISVTGTWMQSVAINWLVLKLTGSAAALGIFASLSYLPVLLLGPWGGVIADRARRRRLLIFTASAAGVLALILAVITQTGVVTVWMVGLSGITLGVINAIDVPTRQAFVLEMVDRDNLTNAVSLNSIIMNGSRVVGPAAAGILIVTLGMAPAFFANAISFIAVIVALLMMRNSELQHAERVAKAKGQLVEGLRYVWRTPEVRTPLLLMAVAGTLAYNFMLTLPLMARFTFHANADAFGLMSSVMGIGAVAGGLVAAARARPNGRALGLAAMAFGAMVLVTAVAPTFPLELVAITIMGAASITFAALCNSTIQLAAAPQMRGRVISLYVVAFLGSTPIGAPIIGFVAQAFGPRVAIGMGGAAVLLAALVLWRSLTGARLRAEPAARETLVASAAR